MARSTPELRRFDSQIEAFEVGHVLEQQKKLISVQLFLFAHTIVSFDCKSDEGSEIGDFIVVEVIG